MPQDPVSGPSSLILFRSAASWYQELEAAAQHDVRDRARDGVVIIDRVAELVAPWEDVFAGDHSRAVLRRNMAKYVMTESELSPQGELSDVGLYRVHPKSVNAWLEGAYPTTQSRWTFELPEPQRPRGA